MKNQRNGWENQGNPGQFRSGRSKNRRKLPKFNPNEPPGVLGAIFTDNSVFETFSSTHRGRLGDFRTYLYGRAEERRGRKPAVHLAEPLAQQDVLPTWSSVEKSFFVERERAGGALTKGACVGTVVVQNFFFKSMAKVVKSRGWCTGASFILKRGEERDDEERDDEAMRVGIARHHRVMSGDAVV